MPIPGVTVIGAGIAGLTAAYRLKQRGIAVKVLETNSWPGGRMAERQEYGMTYNTGARLCYSFYSDLLRLVFELGLQDSVVRHGKMKITCRSTSGDYVLPLKPGLNLLTHSELPWNEKLALIRLLPDLLKARRQINPGWMMTAIDFDEQSLADYLRGKVGPVFLDKFIEPVFRSTRSWNPEEISPALFISTSAQMMPGSYTFGFRDGIGQLTTELAGHVDIEYQAHVIEVKRSSKNDKCLIRYSTNGIEKEIESDIAICAVQGTMLSRLITGPEPVEEEFFKSIKYNPLGIVHAKVKTHEAPGVTFFSRDYSPDLSIVEFTRQDNICKLFCQLSPELSRKLKDMGKTENIYSVIKESLFNLYPDLGIDEQSIINQWIAYKIPLFYPGYIKKITEFQAYQEQAPRRIYYCGDYLAQSLVEGACQSGNHAAGIITRHWQSKM